VSAGRRRGVSALATIHDVARHAGVSIGTVSKAMHGTGQLRPETRDRVLASARHLAFRPNEIAHSLQRGQSFTVGVISNDSFGRFGMPIVEGLEECMSDSRISVFMCNATDDPRREARHVESLLGKRVDGLVVTARRSDRRTPLQVGVPGLPVVYVLSQTDEPGALCILPDDQGGACMATQHLLRLGRRRIAHVTGPDSFEAVRLRIAGYRAALDGAGIAMQADSVLASEWSEAWGRAAIDRLFAPGRDAPDAIFCGNDQIARGAADGLRERGMRVPDDVAIVGYDNWLVLAEAARPPLTTVDMNLKELGREAGRRLIRLIDGEELSGVHRMPCSLVVRASCGALKTST